MIEGLLAVLAILFGWLVCSVLADCFLGIAGEKPIKFGLVWFLWKMFPDKFRNFD